MVRKSTSIPTYLLIVIALGAASLHAVPLVQVARSQSPEDYKCYNAGGTIDADGACVLPFSFKPTQQQCRSVGGELRLLTGQCILPGFKSPPQQQCPKNEVFDPEFKACVAAPIIPPNAAISDDNVDNAEGGDNVDNAEGGEDS